LNSRRGGSDSRERRDRPSPPASRLGRKSRAKKERSRHPLAGFVFKRAAALPPGDKGCVRDSICDLLGLSRSSPLARAIPDEVDATDWPMLAERLGLNAYFRDDATAGFSVSIPPTGAIIVFERADTPFQSGHAIFVRQGWIPGPEVKGVVAVITKKAGRITPD
jgi:hypothetical protein